MKPLSEKLEATEFNSLPNRPHGVKVKLDIMQGIEGRGRHLAGHERDAAGRPVNTCGRCSTAQASSSGRSSSAYAAFLMLSRPVRVKSCPLRAFLVGMHAVEHVDAARHAFDQVGRRAGPHQIAGPVIGQPRGRPARRRRTSRRCGSPTLSPPIAYASKPTARVPSALRSRRSGNTLPCTIPNCACPGLVTAGPRLRSARRARQESVAGPRAAHRSVRSTAARAAS